MHSILEVNHLNKSFKGLKVLEDVSFSLQKGTISVLFGENGSGKTTLFHMISGFLQADKGEIRFDGNVLSGLSPVEIAALGIGRVWQSPRLCKNMTVMDNLLLASKDHPGDRILNYIIRPYRIWKEEKLQQAKAKQIAEELGLAIKLPATAGELSFGQQKLLSIGMLLMNESKLLILDEPFAGVNARMVDQISDKLIGLRQAGKTICMIEHNRTKATMISDKVFTLVKGVIQEGSKHA